MEQQESIIGVLTAATSHDGLAYFFKKDADGEYLNIKFLGGYDQAKSVPLNERIVLCVSLDKTNGFNLVHDQGRFFTELRHP